MKNNPSKNFNTSMEDYYENLKTQCQMLSSFKYIFPYLEGKKVLDIGCGTGEYLSFMGPGSLGIDISEPNLESCREKGLKVKKVNLNKVPLGFINEEFPVIFCSHILEHIENPFQFLKEIYWLLSNKGFFIIGLPTEYSLARYLNDRYFQDHFGHLYGFSLENMKQLLEKSGYIVQRVIIDINWVSKLRLWWLLALVQKLPVYLTIWWSNAYWIIAQKKNESTLSQ